MEKDAIMLVRNAVKRWGRKSVGRALVQSGVNIDTAVRLLNGRYPSVPKEELHQMIKEAIKRCV